MNSGSRQSRSPILAGSPGGMKGMFDGQEQHRARGAAGALPVGEEYRRLLRHVVSVAVRLSNGGLRCGASRVKQRRAHEARGGPDSAALLASREEPWACAGPRRAATLWSIQRCSGHPDHQKTSDRAAAYDRLTEAATPFAGGKLRFHRSHCRLLTGEMFSGPRKAVSDTLMLSTASGLGIELRNIGRGRSSGRSVKRVRLADHRPDGTVIGSVERVGGKAGPIGRVAASLPAWLVQARSYMRARTALRMGPSAPGGRMRGQKARLVASTSAQ